MRIRIVQGAPEGRIVNRFGGDERLQRETPDAHVARRIERAPRHWGRDRDHRAHGGDGRGLWCMLTAAETDQRFEAGRDPETSIVCGLAGGGIDEHRFDTLGVDGSGRRAAERFEDGAAHTRLGFDAQPRDEGVDHGVGDRRTRRAGLRVLERLPECICGLGADFRQRMLQRRQDVGNQRWPFQTSERADGDASGLRIVAVRGRANHCEVAGRRCTAILSLQDPEPRDGRTWRLRRRVNRKKHEDRDGSRDVP